MSRFSHIKTTKRTATRSLDDFVEGANKNHAKKARKRPSKEKVLLSISGRSSSRDEYAKGTLLYIKQDILDDVDKYCMGNKNAILNYLIRRGLDELVADKKVVLEEAE